MTKSNKIIAADDYDDYNYKERKVILFGETNIGLKYRVIRGPRLDHEVLFFEKYKGSDALGNERWSECDVIDYRYILVHLIFSHNLEDQELV